MLILDKEVPCHSNPDMFFSSRPTQLKLAADMCTDCWFYKDCAELGAGETWGVWAGEIKSNYPTVIGKKHGPTCYSGRHKWIPENIYLRSKAELCLRCKEERQNDYSVALAELVQQRLVCPSGGHPWTLENLKYVRKTKTAECKKCKADGKFCNGYDSKLDLHPCRTCKEMKPREQFYKDDNTRCKHVPHCRPCASKLYKERSKKKK